MKKISIIVPIYNVEKYLKECLDSLINQTYSNLEIILVDDGSTDNCPTICNEYAKMDTRIKVIHKKNAGLSEARNSGMEISTGEYIAFVDSDDYVRKDMYEKMMISINEKKADIVMSGFSRIDDNKNIIDFLLPLDKNFYSDKEILEGILLPMIGSLPKDTLDVKIEMSVWKCLYSNEIIKKHQLRFISERKYISEDIIFHLEYFKYVNRLAIVNEALYVYRLNNTSLTKKYNPNRFEKEKILYLEINNRITEINIEQEKKEEAYLREKRSFLMRTRNCIKAEIKNKTLKDKKKRERIKMILEDNVVREVLAKYPINKMPKKDKILNFLLKHKMINTLYWVYKVY